MEVFNEDVGMNISVAMKVDNVVIEAVPSGNPKSQFPWENINVNQKIICGKKRPNRSCLASNLKTQRWCILTWADLVKKNELWTVSQFYNLDI